MTTEPTLADDQARLAQIADELEAALVAAVPSWLRRAATTISPAVESAALEVAITETMANLSPQLTLMLHADVDDGVGSPLAAVRAATGAVTAVLVDSGASPAVRDDFDVRAFPDDLFALGPAAFADIHESLLEPGLTWGAARAHVHLRRRREATT